MSAFKREQYGMPEPNPENYRCGSLFDAMVTCPETVSSFTLTANGKEYTQEEFNLCEKMLADFKKSIYYNMCHGIPQACFAGPITLESGSMQMIVQGRCKADILNDSANAIVEIKTTACTSQEQFEKTIEFLDYDRAGAWYLDLTGCDREIILGVSKKSRKIFPYMIKRDDQTYLRGKSKYVDLAWRYNLMYGDLNFETLGK